MKLRHVFGFALLALLVGVALLSCSLLGTAIDARIQRFVDSLNTDRSSTVDNLVSGSGAYNTINGNPGYWENQFPAGDKPYGESITSSSPYDPNDTEANITSNGPTHLYKFVLQNTGGAIPDYHISALSVSDGSGGWSPVF